MVIEFFHACSYKGSTIPVAHVLDYGLLRSARLPTPENRIVINQRITTVGRYSTNNYLSVHWRVSMEIRTHDI